MKKSIEQNPVRSPVVAMFIVSPNPAEAITSTKNPLSPYLNVAIVYLRMQPGTGSPKVGSMLSRTVHERCDSTTPPRKKPFTSMPITAKLPGAAATKARSRGRRSTKLSNIMTENGARPATIGAKSLLTAGTRKTTALFTGVPNRHLPV